jgi:arylsulfatase A-like enzyme
MEKKEHPNIILINCDDLGYGDLGCYGSERNATPNLDRMAAEGLRLTDFYMASPVCSPSRGAMMTGCYPGRIGFDVFGEREAAVLFPGDPEGIHEDERTLPELLKEQGYRTQLVGKWHCGDQPEFLPCNRGFDGYYGLPYSNDMGRQEGREHSAPLPLIRDDAVIQEQPDQRGLTERYTEECVRFIRENAAGPFFLYLAHMYVHVPLLVPPRFMKESRNGAYGGAVAHIDWTVGVLLDELQRLGIDEDTLILFTSDNGSRARDEGGSNQPCRGTKATTWEGGQRVPCLLRWPGQIAPGRTSSHITSSIDFLPTLVALAGGTVPADRHIDGVAFDKLLFDEDASPVRDSFAFFFRNQLEAVRIGDWKLHFPSPHKPIERPCLFNLAEDVGETIDRHDQEPEVVQRLEAFAQSMRDDLGDALTGTRGQGRRPCGTVPNPSPLTDYDPDHPYMIALYDLADADGSVMAG